MIVFRWFGTKAEGTIAEVTGGIMFFETTRSSSRLSRYNPSVGLTGFSRVFSRFHEETRERKTMDFFFRRHAFVSVGKGIIGFDNVVN